MSATERILRVQNERISLLLHADVFTPSVHGVKGFGEAIQIRRGDRVLEIGTGTGILAILSAKKGGRVTATDISQKAVELARKNAERNNVEIDFRVGSLFAPVKGKKWDVVIANVAQEVLSPRLRRRFSPERVRGIHAGMRGNEILLKLLREAPQYMRPTSELYVAAYGMSNHEKTIQYILTHFDAQLVNFHSSPVKEYIYEDLDWYERQAKAGTIMMYKKSDKYFSDFSVFKLRIKK